MIVRLDQYGSQRRRPPPTCHASDGRSVGQFETTRPIRPQSFQSCRHSSAVFLRLVILHRQSRTDQFPLPLKIVGLQVPLPYVGEVDVVDRLARVVPMHRPPEPLEELHECLASGEVDHDVKVWKGFIKGLANSVYEQCTLSF